VIVIVLIDHFIPNPHDSLDKQDPAFRENSREYLKRVALLTSVAITAHNFPEGLATFFATLESPSVGMPLAFAIAIHNIPEGIAIAVPVYSPPRTSSMRSVPACCRAWPSRWARRWATGCCQDRCRTPRSAGCSA
jgi:zinc transporter ZupT